MPKPGFQKVAELSQVPPGEMIATTVDGESVLIANVDGHIYAVAEVCPHAEAPLAEGYLEDDQLECPWHGSIFNVKSGEALEGPAHEGLPVYPVEVEGDAIYVGPGDL